MADALPTKTIDQANQDSRHSVLLTQPGHGNQTVGSYANDNRSIQPAAVRSGNMSASVYHIYIEGNADDSTVEQFREALAQSENRAVARSRAAAQDDRVAGSGRQRIGGFN